jgi:hypothetical protein
LNLDYVVVQKQKDAQSNEHGFNHIFKLTYFAPWIEETFPASIDDMALFKLFDAKKGPLNRTDIKDILKVKDLFNYGQTIMDLLLGKTSRKYNTNTPSYEYHQ